MAAPTIVRPEVDELDVVAPAPPPDRGSATPPDAPVALTTVWRPLATAALATAAAALVTGGIFGTWSARLLGLAGALAGVAWAWLTLRAGDRAGTFHALLLPAALGLSLVVMIPAGGAPSEMPQLVRDAISSGRLLRPPVPFDPGWIPIVTVVFALLGYGAAWTGTALARPRMAIAIPLPVLALTATTQPDDAGFISGVCALVPLVAAAAVLFGGDPRKAAQLTKEFELARAGRGALATVGVIAALVVLGRANILFPEPVYDPTEQAQKPKPIPLSEIRDRVLFEVRTSSAITGPWRTGVLDVYDGEAWRLPPFDEDRFVDVPDDGIIDPERDASATAVIELTVRDLGDAAALPGPTGATRIAAPDGLDLVFDPRVGVFRVPEGRVPSDLTYSIAMPPYPNADALAAAPPPGDEVADNLEMPAPPPIVRQLLEGAPAEPGWARMDFLRQRLRTVVVAAGGGVPVDISPARVAEILDGPDHEATPYEIVAAEAMLARWAGVPARIGFGFDGVNDEDGVLTVRPRNAAQWLEVWFEGHGWLPLIEAPPQAKQSLADDEQLFDPDSLAADEVAAEVWVPIRVRSPQLLYQQIRSQLLALVPYVVALIALYLATPAAMKQWRRQKRRTWAANLGPRAQVAVEYAELRDFAHDLNVGDPLDTPIEYLRRLVDDPQHAELAWLVARTLYGDLGADVSDEQARAAEELSTSLRRRLARAQPLQARVLAALSRASLRQPYTTEVPSVALLDPLGRWSTWRHRRRERRRARRRARPRLHVLRPLTGRRSA